MDRAQNYGACLQELIDTFGFTMTESAAEAYRKALWQLDPVRLRKATDRALMESVHMPKPAQLRNFARDVVTASGKEELICHFHGDGIGWGGEGRGTPNVPSPESYHWCARCRVFIKQGTQGPDDGKHAQSGTRKLLEAMRKDLGINVRSPAEGIQAFLGNVALEREPGSDDLEPGELF